MGTFPSCPARAIFLECSISNEVCGRSDIRAGNALGQSWENDKPEIFEKIFVEKNIEKKKVLFLISKF